MKPVLPALIAAALAGCLQPADEILSSSEKASQLVFVKEPSVTGNKSNAMKSNVDEFYRGTDICLLTPVSPNGKVVNLTRAHTRGGSENPRDWGAALDPEVSFDGRRILFSMRKAGGGSWHLYEMDVDGGNLLQLTDQSVGDDMDPAYVSDNRIVFSSTRSRIVDEYERRAVPQLHAGERGPDGRLTNIRLISFNQSHDNNPFVHSSGKVYFSRWDHVGPPNKIPLFTINPDGTGLFVLYGADGPRASGSRAFLEARELADGGIVCSLMERNSPFEGGAIVIIDLSRFTDPPVFITPDDVPFTTTRDTANALFKTPYPVRDGGKERLLVAMSPHAAGRDMRESVDYGLYVMDKDGGNLTLVYNDASTNEYDPVLVEPRRLPVKPYSNPEVETAIAQGVKTGMFFDADVYSRMDNDGHMKPDRDFVNADGSKGQAKYLRILEAVPMPVDRDRRGGNPGRTNFEKQRVIGYADIRADGSFSVQVPANTPMHLQTLDQHGLMLVNQFQWIQVMPGERRLCTGCHGPRERDTDIGKLDIHPDNTVSMRLETVKNFLSGFHNAQIATEHASLRPDTVDFYDPRHPEKASTVQAVFHARCNECHSAAAAAASGGGLVLEQTADSLDGDGLSEVYERLTRDGGYRTADGESRPYATQAGARRSPLMWVLFNRQLDQSGEALYRTASYDHSAMWAKDQWNRIDPFQPANADLLLLIEWLDMGMQFSNTVGYGYDK